MKAKAFRAGATTLAAATILFSLPAAAQDAPREPLRVRIALGPQLVPNYPGADDPSLRPYIGAARTRGDTPFEFSAPDQSGGFSILNQNGFSAGPIFGFEGRRRARDTDNRLPAVKRTVELGGFVQYFVTPELRARFELRQGLGGHDGLVGMVGADYVNRDGDDWVFSVGPRVTFSNGRYQRAYFGVTTPQAVAAGLPAYAPGGGIHAVGAAAGYGKQLSREFGVIGYVKYDRLIDDAGDSPVVRTFGDRNQLSGGVALTYTFNVNGL